MKRPALALLVMLGTATLAAPAAAQAPGAVPATVRDLAWGEVLFRLYQQDRMGALVRLGMAEARGELPFHGGEARLLRGGLYLAWGLRDEAARIFEALLAAEAPPAQHDQAWYWLARIRFERGEQHRALDALRRIGGDLPATLAADRIDLEGRVLLALGYNIEAAQLLADAGQPGAWRAFADFNRAVALARAGQDDAAQSVLDELGRARAETAERALLRDRANLALGLARLDAGDAGGARAALDRVRLEGAYGPRALLAAGWAEAERGRYRAALGPWSTLATLADADGAALEAMLAVPWAWHQADEPGESLLGYQRAVAACESELGRLAMAVRSAERNDLLDVVAADPDGAEVAPHGPLAVYVHALAVDHPFRAVAADLRDLDLLRQNLREWRRSLAALRDMVDARRARFAQVAPRVEARLADDDLERLEARHVSATRRLEAARQGSDQGALANPEERRLLDRVGTLQARVAALPPGVQRDLLHERLQRVQGALTWQLNHAWPARLHEAQREQRAAGAQLDAAREMRASLAASLAAGPSGFEGYDDRIDAAAARVDRLLARVETDHARRFGELQALVLVELESREQRVSAYLGQARFALAAAYDQAAQPRIARGGAPAADVGTPR